MRVGTVTLGQIATFLIVMSLGLPMPSEAGVFWTEDFENYLTPNWDTSACINLGVSRAPQVGCNAVISRDFANNSMQSLKSHYPDAIKPAGTYYDRGVPLSKDLWMRFYSYTNAFNYAPEYTKVFYNLGPNVEIVLVNKWGSREMSVSVITSGRSVPCPGRGGVLDTDCVLNPNVGHVPLGDNRWYCIESHVNGGDAGAANGVVELFVDGIQTIRYSNVTVTTSGDNRFNLVRHYTQNGLGDRYIDNLAVGNTRIGCSGSLQTDNTPPAAPMGLIVR